MKRPQYVAPNNQRDGYQQPPVYSPPATFEHADVYVLPKDTPVEIEEIIHQQPIPVTVVEMPRGPERVVTFVATQFTINAQQELPLSRNDNRRNLRILNVNAFSNIYIGAKAGQSTNVQGYPLRPGAEIVINSTMPVYLFNAEAVNSIQVGVFYELVTELA